MSNIINVVPKDDFTLLIEFEGGHKILFNLQRFIKTIPYSSLNHLERFKKIRIEDKAICWQDADSSESSIRPIMLTLDNILFAIRD